jgi:RNA polymerase sigma-70 factor, ECF subfamily
MPLTSVDRALIERCLAKEVGSWNDFVDRYLGLFYHVIRYTAHLRSLALTPEEVEDLAQEIMLQIVANDYQVLKAFRGQSSLSSYLTVIGRRIAVQEMIRRQVIRKPLPAEMRKAQVAEEHSASEQIGLDKLEEVHRLLRRLPSKERAIVRLFYLEGRSYEEISTELEVPVNTIGPILSRARKKLREYAEQRIAK